MVAGGKLAHASQDRERGRHDGVKAHVVVQRSCIDLSIDSTSSQQRWEGGCEAQHACILGEVERFDAKPVASHDDPAVVALPEHEGKHAVKALDAAWPPGVISLENDLGVAVREEAVAFYLQLLTQTLKVVDAAIEDEGEPEFRGHHGLLGGRAEIEDTETTVAERNPILGEVARGI